MVDETPAEERKSFKTLPGFYQDILGSLLIVFSSSHESIRFNIARDLAGYVESLLRYTRSYDYSPEYDDTTTFGKMAEKARLDIDSATLLYREGGSPGTALQKLGAATDSLKQIIIMRRMISEGFEIRRTNPLASSSLEGDSGGSSNYRRVE